MSTNSNPSRDRLLDLLADRALEGGLAPFEDAEVNALLRMADDIDAEELDYAAAALASALAAAEPMPTDLRSRVSGDAGVHIPAAAGADVRPAEGPGVAGRALTLLLASGWLAALSLAVALWLKWPAGPGPLVAEKKELSPRDRLARLLKAADVIRARGDGGEVVWSNRRQEGYMRLTGLDPNDPKKRQYQLWIVDTGRDGPPVDGGVFDVTERGEAIIPIDAKLKVFNPSLFAITEEPPGGVVKSEQKGFVFTAVVDG